MKLYLLFLFTLSFISSESQTNKTISYFEENGELAEPGNSLYFRVSTDTADYYRSYYTKDSALMFKGFILSAKDSSDKKNIYDGNCEWFFPNKNKKLNCSFSRGVQNGLYIEYNEQGKKVKEIYYVLGKIKNDTYTEYYHDHDSTIILKEDFSLVSKNWEDGNPASKYKLGAIELSSTSGASFINKGSTLPPDNFSIEATVHANYFQERLLGGLVFGYADKNNYHYFFIDRYKLYIGEVVDGKDIPIIDGINCKTIKPDTWNVLKIIFLSNKIEFGINNQIQVVTETKSPKGYAGLGTKNAGNCIFDNFILKISSDSTFKRLPFSPFGEFSTPRGMISIKNIATGTVLNKEGVVLTALPAIPEIHSKIIIGAFIKDSLKWFNADILLKSETSNLLFLKSPGLIADSSEFILPSFFNKDRIEPGTEIFSYQFDQNFQLKITQPMIVTGKLVTKARYENFLTTFECLFPLNQFTVGTPVVTKENEILGIISNPAQTGISKAIKIIEVEKMIFTYKKLIKKKTDPAKKGLSPNIVLIITL